jgi:hypothetical protein
VRLSKKTTKRKQKKEEGEERESLLRVKTYVDLGRKEHF